MTLKTKRILCLTIAAISLLTIVSTISYAYFTAIAEVKNQKAYLSSANMRLRFADDDAGISANLNFGETIIKKFTLENIGTVESTVRMSWLDLINTYTDGSLTYTLSYTTDENGPFTKVIDKSNIPRSQVLSKRTLASALTIPVNTTYYYNLEITLNYLDTINQNADINAIFNSKFSIEDVNEKYQVTFDPNGGIVNMNNKTISKGDDYGNLPVPTKEGYVFMGWFTEEDKGTPVIDSMPILINDNHILYAHWKLDTIMMAFIGNDKIWNHSKDIKRIVFETTINPKQNATYTYDISYNQNKSVMSYLVPDSTDSTKYTAYIQADGKIKATDCAFLFFNFNNLEIIEGLENLDTKSATSMRYMFYGCKSLTSLDLSSLDTSNATIMSDMFTSCTSLKELKLNGIDTSKVTSMSYMFSNCSALTSLDLSSLDTGNVTSMESMFINCSTLTTLDLSNFDTSDVTNMSYMFNNCSSLKKLNLSNFNTEKVATMSLMFYNCSSLNELNISNFTLLDNNITEIFYGVPSMIKITVRNNELGEAVIEKSSTPKLTMDNIVIG